MDKFENKNFFDWIDDQKVQTDKKLAELDQKVNNMINFAKAEKNKEKISEIEAKSKLDDEKTANTLFNEYKNEGENKIISSSVQSQKNISYWFSSFVKNTIKKLLSDDNIDDLFLQINDIDRLPWTKKGLKESYIKVDNYARDMFI